MRSRHRNVRAAWGVETPVPVPPCGARVNTFKHEKSLRSGGECMSTAET